MSNNADPEGVILEKLLTSVPGSSNRQRRYSDEDSVCTIDLGRKSAKRNDDKEELDFELNDTRKKPRIDQEDLTRGVAQERSRSFINESPFLCLDDEKENIGPLSPVPDDVYDHDNDEDDIEVEIPMPEVRHRRVLRLIPEVPYISVATCDGTRVYLRLKSEKDVLDEGKNKFDKPKRNLLGVDFYDLKREATDKLEEFQASISSQIVENEKNKENKSIKDVEDGKNLWVDKYRPISYNDLISDESMNRNLLHWIKLFDKVVFGNDYLAKVKATREKYSKLDLKEKEREQYIKNKIVVEDDAYDPTGRPKQKFALLHGPPGLGKTTAAHIIAKQAGYNVIEMNASDDRSMEIFKKMLDSAIESRSEYFNHGKPNCLIIDEIDGAPQATVNLLVDLVTGKAIEKGRSKTPKVLKRPIICICNDLYAPSLKNLRKLGFILEFQPVAISSLVERLEAITLKEKFSIDSGTLRELAEKTECDVRSCLSTLQFLKKAKSNKSNINTAKLLNQVAKMDKNKGIFSLWSSIFIQPAGKRYYDSADQSSSSSEKRFQNILKIAQNFGEYEKVAAGVFENYLRVKFRDSYFRNIIEGLNWMIWFEEIRGHIERSQNYSMFGYMPCFFVVCHFLFSSKNWVKLQYPNSEILNRSNKIVSLVKTQLGELNPNLGKYLDTSGLLLDVFPHLLSIIQPDTIRPVPTQLWSAQERETIKNIVELMIHYNLNYVQNRTPEGNYAYMLEPDLDAISRFSNLESGNNKKVFPYTIKQLVAREIETEKLKRIDGEFESIPSSSSAINHLNVDAPAAISRSPSSISDWIKKSTESKRKITDDTKITVTKDFFGRTIVPSPRSTAIQEAKRKKDEKFDIWYRYKEGFSNAVRKNLKVKDFV